jgi:hypothetical protein
VFLGGHFLDAADEDVEFARVTGSQVLDGGDLFLGADEAGDGPGALEEKGGEELGDFAVTADEENVVRHVAVVWWGVIIVRVFFWLGRVGEVYENEIR